jgi:hypothetical protein
MSEKQVLSIGKKIFGRKLQHYRDDDGYIASDPKEDMLDRWVRSGQVCCSPEFFVAAAGWKAAEKALSKLPSHVMVQGRSTPRVQSVWIDKAHRQLRSESERSFNPENSCNNCESNAWKRDGSMWGPRAIICGECGLQAMPDPSQDEMEKEALRIYAEETQQAA